MITYGFDQVRYLFSLQIVFLGFIIFSTITLVSGWISANFASYQKLNNGMKKEWRCRVTAFSHSIFAIVAMTYAAITFPYALEPEAMLRADTDAIRFTESICCGYFLWDALIIIWYWNDKETDYFGVSGIIHGVMCSIVYLASLAPFGMYLTGLHLLFEYSTPFLHIRWFLIKSGKADNTFSIVNDYVFVFVFFIARVCMGPYYIYLYIFAYTSTAYDPMNYIFMTSIATSNGLNYFWFYCILHSALVASPTEKKEKSKKRRKNKAK